MSSLWCITENIYTPIALRAVADIHRITPLTVPVISEFRTKSDGSIQNWRSVVDSEPKVTGTDQGDHVSY
eukprot:6678522-Karenia_brevis.AAC.1